MSEQQTYDEELMYCPECDGYLTAEAVEHIGDGDAIRQIGCQECGWSGTEMWTHEVTEENT